MPILATLFGSLFSSFVGFLIKFVSRKVAIATAAVASLAAFTAALLTLFNAVVTPLASSMFSTSYGQVIGLAFPPAAGSSLAAMGSVWTACTLYAWQYRATQLAVQS